MAQSRTPFDLSGKVVLLTGAAGILGGEFAAALAGQGAHVALADLDADRLHALCDELNALYEGRLHAYQTDITSAAAVAELQQRVENEIGAADVLVNNAAAKSPNFFAPFETFPFEDWEAVMAVNTTAVARMCQAFGGAMAARGGGSIVNILSIYGIVAPDQRIYEGSEYEGQAINTPAVYSASKAAAWGLTKYLAAYWGRQGVRVNAITPGGVFSGQNDAFVEKYSQRVPLGRMAERSELTGALLFLASDESSYVTGQNIVVDGGLTAW